MLHALLLAVPLAAIDPPRVEALARYADDSVAGRLLRNGKEPLPFHLDVANSNAVLWIGAKHRRHDGASRAAYGSKVEAEVIAALRKWADDRYQPAARAIYYGVERLNQRRDPVSGEPMEWDDYLAAQLLRALRRYERRTRVTIEKAKARKGQGLMLRLALDGATLERVFVRRSNGEPRLFVNDGEKPLAIGGRRELGILAVVQAWFPRNASKATLARLAAGDKGADIDATVRAVYGSFRDYRQHTFPRVTQIGVLRDGGSVRFHLVEATGAATTLQFDNQIGTKTPGRLKVKDGRQLHLLNYGDPEEKRLFAALRKWLARAERAGDKSAARMAPLINNYSARRPGAAKRK